MALAMPCTLAMKPGRRVWAPAHVLACAAASPCLVAATRSMAGRTVDWIMWPELSLPWPGWHISYDKKDP
jgi:hypothetical protein